MDEEMNVKLIDVEFVRELEYGGEETLDGDVGTEYYQAPEVGKGPYNHSADVYSTGIMLLEKLPYLCLDNDLKWMIIKMKRVNPSKRPSIEEVLRCPVFDKFREQQEEMKCDDKGMKEEEEGVEEEMK